MAKYEKKERIGKGKTPCYELDLYLNFALTDLFAMNGEINEEDEAYCCEMFRHRSDLPKIIEHIRGLSEEAYEREYKRLQGIVKGCSREEKEYIVNALLDAALHNAEASSADMRDLIGSIATEIDAADVWQRLEERLPADEPNAELVARCGIVRKEGYLYYVDKNGNVKCQYMNNGKTETLYKTGIKCDPKYLYFLDNNGDVSRSLMR